MQFFKSNAEAVLPQAGPRFVVADLKLSITSRSFLVAIASGHKKGDPWVALD
jgi:hypothetical protein